jgi:hypothetical protein
MADVMTLPTAAAQRVEQQPRRGRLPRCVTNIYLARHRRRIGELRRADQEYQRGVEESRRQHQEERDYLMEVSKWLAAAAADGNVYSFVLAADVRGHGLVFYTAGSVLSDEDRALLMATRLQHRLAAGLYRNDADD